MNKINISIRIILLCLPFIVPWWLVVILSLAALFFFNFYWEVVIIGIMLDTIYTTSLGVLGLYFFTITSLVCLFVTYHIKQRLIVY